MGEHTRETVHHGVRMVRADGDVWGCAPVVGFQATRKERATWEDSFTVAWEGPVRDTQEQAWEDMWRAGDEFHDDGWTFARSGA